MTAVIQTQELTRRFGETVAVRDLTLNVNHGEVFGFLGHNGAGKTTTIRLLNGVISPTSGEAAVLGLSAATQGAKIRAHTGVLTETPSLDERLTAWDNLAIYADLYAVPPKQITGRVQNALEMFDLADRAQERVGGYSKGMKQRLALARAFIHAPELVFLDEPTAGLDPVAARQVHDLIGHISRDEGRTVFLCTHNLYEAQRLCDRVAVMEQGRMVVVGAPNQLGEQIGLGIHFDIEVAPDDLNQAQDVLVMMTNQLSSYTIDEGVIQIKGARRDWIPELLAEMVAHRIRVYSVVPQAATLEDVYFALHQTRSERVIS